MNNDIRFSHLSQLARRCYYSALYTFSSSFPQLRGSERGELSEHLSNPRMRAVVEARALERARTRNGQKVQHRHATRHVFAQ